MYASLYACTSYYWLVSSHNVVVTYLSHFLRANIFATNQQYFYSAASALTVWPSRNRTDSHSPAQSARLESIMPYNLNWWAQLISNIARFYNYGQRALSDSPLSLPLLDSGILKKNGTVNTFFIPLPHIRDDRKSEMSNPDPVDGE